MGFHVAGGRDTTINASTEDVARFLREVLDISLTPIPIGPGASPVYVTPTIGLDLTAAFAYDAKIGQRAVFYNTGEPFKYLLNVTQPDGPVVPETNYPGFNMNAELYFNGEFSASAGVIVSLGLAPYSRSLFTLGTQIGAEPTLTVSGFATAGLRAGMPVGQFSANAGIDLKATGGLFFDADFFGLAGDAIDQEVTIWEETYSIAQLGIDNSCGFYFDNISADISCRDETAVLNFSARVVEEGQTDLDVDGTYELYFDGLLIGSGYTPDQTFFVDLPEGTEPGVHRIRFVREGGQSIFFCERDVMVQVVDCSLAPCTGVARVQDARIEDQFYCSALFNDERWMTRNLFTLLPNGDLPDCLDNEPDLCRAYGGYFTFDELLEVGRDESPVDLQGLCPEGYHVPTLGEWLNFFNVAEGTPPNADGEYYLPERVEPYKDAFTWTSGANIAFLNGFNAQAAGVYTDSSNPVFSGVGEAAYFWTSTVTPDNPTGAYAVEFDDVSNAVTIRPTVRLEGMGCRCVKD